MFDLYANQKHQNMSSVRLLILFVLGSLISMAAELPYGGWAQILLLSLVWWRLSSEVYLSRMKFFTLGMTFGLGYFVAGLWWLYISLHDVGGMNTLLSCMAVFLLSAYMALYFSIACLSIRLFKTSYVTGLFLASGWVVSEYLRGKLFTGFPWMGFAEAQMNGPFAPIAPFFGGLACTFFVIWTSWEIAQIKRCWLFSTIGIVSVIAVSQLAGLITFTKPFGEPISVRLIQGNFEQSLKLNPLAISQQIDFYANEIKKEAANLIIIPETAFPWPQDNLPPELFNYLQDFANKSTSNILLGLIGEVKNNSEIQYTNRAVGLLPNAAPYQYDKVHLVPFGEFIPLGFQWFVKAFHVPMSDFASGGFEQAPFNVAPKDQTPILAAITICYEDVFGGELASRIRNNTQPTNLLINITNLAWFGKSQAPAQQLRLSQLRSLETGLPALRATNTGITAVLGADGKVLQILPEFTQATLSTQVQAYSGKTLYVNWGDVPILSISCLLLIWGLIRHRRF